MPKVEQRIYRGSGIDAPVNKDGTENSITEEKTTSSLSFYLEGDIWEMEQIDVSPEGQGIGKELIRKFVSAVGSGEFVHGDSLEQVSAEQLRSLGLYKKTIEQESIEVSDTVILSQLKLAHLLSGGGVQVYKLRMSAEDPKFLGPQWFHYTELIEDGKYIHVQFFGRTT